MTFTFNGIRMYYETGGEGEHTLLLLHGWGGSIASFLPVTRDLSPSLRVVIPDLPGFGKSDEPPADWNVDDYALLIAAFIKEVCHGKTDIIAHSFGGRIALRLSAMDEGLIGRQILTGCAGLLPKEDKEVKLKSKIAHSLSGVYDNRFTRTVLGTKTVDGIKEAVRSHFGSADYRAASKTMREVFKNVVAQDLEYCLKSVTASTLLIWGENDTATPLWMGQKMEEEIKDAALITFENAGHFAYIQQYGRFIAIAKQFLLS